MPTMYIMSGLPGSGKTTWVNTNLPRCTRASADSFFEFDGVYKFDAKLLVAAHSACYSVAERAVCDGLDVVVDNTNLAYSDFKGYVGLAREHGYRVVVIRCTVTISEAIRRNVHRVPEGAVCAMARKRLELPAWLEVRNVETA